MNFDHVIVLENIPKTCGPIDMGHHAILFNSNRISMKDAIRLAKAGEYSPYVLMLPMAQLNGIFYDRAPTINPNK